MKWMPPALAEGVKDDADTLAWLHDAELRPAFVHALKHVQFPSNLALLPQRDDTRAAWEAMARAVAGLHAHPAAAEIDGLAADYAEIYLTGALGVSPYESFWTDDDHLICQDAMFELRALYAGLGFATADWRRRPDDHLVLQLLYVGEAARAAKTPDDWRTLGKALDRHLLQWLEAFCGRVAARSGSGFYVALAVLTWAWLETLRDLIADRLGEPRPDLATLRARPAERAIAAAPIHFVPGTAPSW